MTELAQDFEKPQVLRFLSTSVLNNALSSRVEIIFTVKCFVIAFKLTTVTHGSQNKNALA